MKLKRRLDHLFTATPSAGPALPPEAPLTPGAPPPGGGAYPLSAPPPGSSPVWGLSLDDSILSGLLEESRLFPSVRIERGQTQSTGKELRFLSEMGPILH